MENSEIWKHFEGMQNEKSKILRRLTAKTGNKNRGEEPKAPLRSKKP